MGGGNAGLLGVHVGDHLEHEGDVRPAVGLGGDAVRDHGPGEVALVRALTSAHSGHAGMFYVLSVYWCTSKKAETSTENTHK